MRNEATSYRRCRSLTAGTAIIGRVLSRWDLGCSPARCCESSDAELLQYRNRDLVIAACADRWDIQVWQRCYSSS